MNIKLIITTFMLLAFIGQTVVVAAVPCSMNSTMNMADSSTMSDHSMHQNQSDLESGSKSDPKSECLSDCSCPMATCLSVLISSDSILSSTVNVKQSFDVTTSLAIINPIKSLYRPPITR